MVRLQEENLRFSNGCYTSGIIVVVCFWFFFSWQNFSWSSRVAGSILSSGYHQEESSIGHLVDTRAGHQDWDPMGHKKVG